MSRPRERIYMTAAEAEYIAKKVREKGWQYFAIDYENQAISHKLFIVPVQTLHHDVEIPPQKEDEGIW